MSEAQKLSVLKVKTLNQEGMHSDGNGLNLKVSKTGSKSWIHRYMINGKAVMMGLGAYPEVTLAEARERVAANRAKIRAGVDPMTEKKEKVATIRIERARDVMTFNRCAAKYIEAFAPSWKNTKHADQWRNTLTTYASPIIGALDVGKIETDHIMRILEKDKFWHEKTETAHRVRGRIESVLDWATVRGFRKGDNPARWKGHIEYLLPARSDAAKEEHHPALPHEQMPAFMGDLQKREGIAALACQFAILTAARSGEVRLATWAEIDFEAELWIVPAARMKMKREHRVPLSSQAMVLLDQMKRIQSGALIFPGMKENKPLSDMTLGAVFKRMHETQLEIDSKGWIDSTSQRIVTIHGTARSTFRDWIADETEYPSEMGELALAHAVGDKVEAAYRRGSMLKRRFLMMQDWADYCYLLKKSENI